MRNSTSYRYKSQGERMRVVKNLLRICLLIFFWSDVIFEYYFRFDLGLELKLERVGT